MASSVSSNSGNQQLSTSTKIINIQAEEILIKNGHPLAKLDPNHPLKSFSLGERIQGGRTILKLANLVTPAELDYLTEYAIAEAEERKRLARKRDDNNTDDTSNSNNNTIFLEQGNAGKVFVRLLTQTTARRENAMDDSLSEPVSKIVDQILERALTFLDGSSEEEEQVVCPSLKTTLFGQDTPSIAQLFRDNKLVYSSREPAINVYEAPHGHFMMHKDHHALSIVIPLSDPKVDFKGGGTAFWSQSNPLAGMDPPSLTLKPKPGTAMLWGGRVSHKGVRISEGTRVVLVASFSGPEGLPEDPTERLSAGLGIKTILSGR